MSSKNIHDDFITEEIASGGQFVYEYDDDAVAIGMWIIKIQLSISGSEFESSMKYKVFPKPFI